MGPVGRPETSVRNYHYTLRKNPEEHSSHLLYGGSLESCMYVKVRNSFIGASPSWTSRHYCTQLSYHMPYRAHKTCIFRNFAAWLWKLKALQTIKTPGIVHPTAVSHRTRSYSSIPYLIVPGMNTAWLQKSNHISVVWDWIGGRGPNPTSNIFFVLRLHPHVPGKNEQPLLQQQPR
jgi:hypothetical protein